MRGFAIAVLVAVVLSAAGAAAQTAALSADDKKTISDFEKRLKRYVKDRQALLDNYPKLPADATAEQMEAHKLNLQAAVRAIRVNAKHGDIFTQQITRLFMELIKNEYAGFEVSELRKAVLEADTAGVPLAVNVAYPDTKELVQLSPAFLLALPQLPKELRYRFIGRSLVILDRDNALILDFIRNALP